MRKPSVRFELHSAGKMRIEDLFVDSQAETDYTQHGATWNMPNHFPWTKQPFSPFEKNGNAGGKGVRTIVVTASWNNCSKEGADRGTVISGINESGAAVGVGSFRNKKVSE